MRFAAVVLLVVSTSCAADWERTIEVDTDEVYVPFGATREVGVIADGLPLATRTAVSWVVEDPAIASVTFGADPGHVTIIGLAEGDTVIHLGYRTAVIEIPTHVMPIGQ